MKGILYPYSLHNRRGETPRTDQWHINHIEKQSRSSFLRSNVSCLKCCNIITFLVSSHTRSTKDKQSPTVQSTCIGTTTACRSQPPTPHCSSHSPSCSYSPIRQLTSHALALYLATRPTRKGSLMFRIILSLVSVKIMFKK